MSTQTEEAAHTGTKPIEQHAWLRKLVGEWRVTSEMVMAPGQPPVQGQGREVVQDIGGLWAFGQGEATMPDGARMEYFSTLGYDVSFKEYRGAWFASVSSHLWKYTGTLSEDGRVMTLECVGPHMEKDGETANYRDVIEIIDENHRTLTSYGQDESGAWQQFMVSHYERV